MSDRTVKPVVDYHTMVERPDYALGMLESSTQAASDYTLVAGASGLLIGTMILSQLIKKAPGPYGGLVEAGVGLVKTIFNSGK